MRKYLKIIFLIIILLFFLRACISVDRVPLRRPTGNSSSSSLVSYKSKSLPPFKTVFKDGREFLVARGEVGKYGGELKTSTIGEGPKTFNPWNAKDSTSSDMGNLMFDGLVTTDAYSGEVIPKMAKEIIINPNQLEYTVVLRRGLKWSDGIEITADDVVFTWKDIIFAGYGNTSMRDNLFIEGKLPTVEKIDKYTVKFSTPKPFAPFFRQLSAPIAPKHILEPVVKKGKDAFFSFWDTSAEPESFVTSGAFKLKEYIPAQRVIFERNPDYYMMDKDGNKLPYLDKYIVYIVGDLNNELLKFESKEIDVLNVRGNSVARFKQMEKKGNYTIYNLGANTGTIFVVFNLNQRKDKNGKYYVPQYKQEWFNDLNFRTAVDYAIDRETIVSNILYGVGAEAFGAEGLSSIYLNEEVAKGHKRDIKKAKEYLLKSGFYYDKNGNLFDKHGRRVEFNLLTNAGNTERESIGVMIKQDLTDIGMKVNFRPIEYNSLIGKLTDSYDWDSCIMGLTGSPLEPHSGRNVWASDGTLHLFNMRKSKEDMADVAPWEKEMDKIFDLGAGVIDFKSRKKYYDRYQAIIYEQKPLIYLYSPLIIIAVRNKFGNLHPTPLGGIVHNLEEIYVK